jgi:hypothetical protein
MIDPDVQLPRARERLLVLCNLLSQANSAEAAADLTVQIERTALDIGFVFAVDLARLGWRPDGRAASELSARLAQPLSASPTSSQAA